MRDECGRARELLTERLDRPLDERERLMLQQHLTCCPACLSYERSLLSGLAGIAALPPVPGSRAVRASVLERIETRRARAWLGQGGKLLAAGAACVVFTLILAAILRGGAPTLGDGGQELDAGQSIGADGEATVSPDAGAMVLTPTIAPAPLAVCLPSIAPNAVDANDAALPADAYQIWVLVQLTEGCALTEEVTITLVDANGAALEVENNPLTLPVISLSAVQLTYVGVVWENWCGAPAVRVEVMHGTGGSGRSLDATPACADPDAPSRLVASDTPLPQELWPTATPPVEGTQTPLCALALSSVEMTQEVMGDGVVISVSGEPAEDCPESATITISLIDDSGALLDIDNNPANVPAHRMSDDDSRLYAGVNWINWCGDASVSLSLLGKEGDAGEALGLTPPCVDASAPSRLVWGGPVEVGEEDALPLCTVEEVGLFLSIERSHGDVIIAANAGTEDLSGNVTPLCLLPVDGPTFTVNDTAGNPLPIEGNGAVSAFSAPDGEQFVGPVAGFAHAIWENWCAVPAPSVVTATFGGATADLTLDAPPDCEDASAPSTLRSPSGAAPEPVSEAAVTQEP